MRRSRSRRVPDKMILEPTLSMPTRPSKTLECLHKRQRVKGLSSIDPRALAYES